MVDELKIRCPSCKGNIAIERAHYDQLAGTIIECVHCKTRMTVPAPTTPQPSPPPNQKNLKRTQKLQLVPVDQPSTPSAPSRSPTLTPIAKENPQTDQDPDAIFCPHCKVEVGAQDLVCIECESTLL